jgi:predicted metal-dependent hydrolase
MKFYPSSFSLYPSSFSLQMTPVVPPEEFWHGVEQFNQQDFYACHDTLEALWIEAFEPQKRFYQGILQIAVACYHLSNLNWRGAVILLGEGIGRLRDYQPVYEEIDVTELITQSAQLLQALQQTGAEQVEAFVQQMAIAPKGQREAIAKSGDGENKGDAISRFPKIERVDA